jgi:hypothetical protein
LDELIQYRIATLEYRKFLSKGVPEGLRFSAKNPLFSLKGIVRRGDHFVENIVRRGDHFGKHRSQRRSFWETSFAEAIILWRTSFAEAIIFFEHRIAKVTPQVKRTLFEETTDPS